MNIKLSYVHNKIRLISKEGENTVIRKPKITITVRKTTKKEMIQGTIVWGVLIAVLGLFLLQK